MGVQCLLTTWLEEMKHIRVLIKYLVVGPTSIWKHDLQLNRTYVMSKYLCYEVRILEYYVRSANSAGPAHDDGVLSVVDFVYEVTNLLADHGKWEESR
jgi:hypothetical protein